MNQGQFSAIWQGFLSTLLTAFSFVQYFLSALIKSPVAIMVVVVLLLATKKGGLKLGKNELTVGK